MCRVGAFRRVGFGQSTGFRRADDLDEVQRRRLRSFAASFSH